MSDFSKFFDRVYVINLQRRPDRLRAFLSHFQTSDWPFQQPQVFTAIDGDKVPCPPEFTEGGGAFGCRQSHLGILQECLMDNVDSVLILEDDARLLPGFKQNVNTFLSNVPNDWEGLYLGGQHIRDPWPNKPGIVRATDVERTHAYACRGRYMLDLFKRWSFATVHIDWMMRDWQHQYRVYCPERFLIAQAGSKSDISGRFNGTQSWNPATGQEPVIFLKAPRTVAEKLPQWGLHLGYNRDSLTGYDVGLCELIQETQTNPTERQLRLGNWIRCIQGEALSEPGTVCTVWHPECDEKLIRAATQAPIFVIQAETVESAVAQLPCELELKHRPSAARHFIILLKAPKSVVSELRDRGFHTGHWRDEHGIDRGLAEIYRNKSKENRITALSKWLVLLQSEAERILDGVVVVWHPEAVLSEIEAATKAEVIEIEASLAEVAWELWHSKLRMTHVNQTLRLTKNNSCIDQLTTKSGVNKLENRLAITNKVDCIVRQKQSRIVAVVSVFDSPSILPHFVRHYHRLGVDRLCVALSCEYDTSSLLQEYPDFLRFHRTTYECFKNSYKHAGEEELLVAEDLDLDDWVLHLDLDEFQQYPAHLRDVIEVAEARNIWAILGHLYDRVTEDGSMPSLRDDIQLDEQFPLGGWLTGPLFGGQTRKVMLCRRRVTLRSGRHDTVNASIDRWPIGNVGNYKVHHFRWSAELLARLEARWTEEERRKLWYIDRNLSFCRNYRKNGKFDLSPKNYQLKKTSLIYPERHTATRSLARLNDPWGLDARELELLAKLVRRLKIETVLQIGTGHSIAAFAGCGCQVTAIECNPNRLNAQRDLCAGMAVKLLGFSNADPIHTDLAIEERFDLCFVDGPQGTSKNSRMAAVRFAAEHSNTILLHDSKRTGERQTIEHMMTLGWLSESLKESARGMTLLTRPTFAPPIHNDAEQCLIET